jgi:hypothetical protein
MFTPGVDMVRLESAPCLPRTGQTLHLTSDGTNSEE